MVGMLTHKSIALIGYIYVWFTLIFKASLLFAALEETGILIKIPPAYFTSGSSAESYYFSFADIDEKTFIRESSTEGRHSNSRLTVRKFHCFPTSVFAHGVDGWYSIIYSTITIFNINFATLPRTQRGGRIYLKSFVVPNAKPRGKYCNRNTPKPQYCPLLTTGG